MSIRLSLIVVLGFILAACAAGPITPAAALPPATPSATLGLAGQSVQAQQTARAAIQTQEALQVVVAQATADAQSTRDANAFSVTVTEQARSFGLTATADANQMTVDALRLTQAQEAATATAQAVATQAALNWRGTDVAATSTQFSVTVTADAVTRVARQEALLATQEAQDAERAERRADYYSSLIPLLVTLTTLALCILVGIGTYQIMTAMWVRQWVMETRAGTLLLAAGRNGPSATIIEGRAVADEDRGEEYQPSEARYAVVSKNGEPHHLLMLEGAKPADDPVRRRALKLLRRAMEMTGGGHARRIPGAEALGWPAETWTAAVKSLKPAVETRRGRGGGTWVAEEYRDIAELYDQVGRRIVQIN